MRSPQMFDQAVQILLDEGAQPLIGGLRVQRDAGDPMAPDPPAVAVNQQQWGLATFRERRRIFRRGNA